MSWMQQLCSVYDANTEEIGKRTGGVRALKPIFHVTMQAHIEIAIDTDGQLIRGCSRAIEDKGEQDTLMPATEKAAGRTSGAQAMPLFDKLSYIAGDYERYTGQRGHFEMYLAGLKEWLDFSNHQPLQAIYTYLCKKTMIRDLIEEGILFVGEDGFLMSKWSGEGEKPPVFRAVPSGEQEKAVVRIRLYSARGSLLENDEPWNDRTLWDSWIDFEKTKAGEKALCYATGEYAEPSAAAPRNIRRAGDGAKLISKNDNANYTFRGRFENADQAVSVSREAAEKSHAALSWLISRQGCLNGDQVIVSWRRAGDPSLSLLGDTEDLFSDLGMEPPQDTGVNFARSLSSALLGYEKKLDEAKTAVIMGLDSATSGRLSIFYYQETAEKQLVDNIKHWHETMAFPGMSKSKKTGANEKGKDEFKKLYFTGAPSVRQIFHAAYGMNADDKLKKVLFERLLPCISSRARIPRDIMLSAAHRASRPLAADEMEDKGRTLAVACALIRKYHNDRMQNKQSEEEWNMYLDENVNDRSYLFGRMLAYAQNIERYAQREKERQSGDEKRATNADRLRAAFAQHPARTWKIIDRQLMPYINQLGGKAYYLREALEGVMSRIPVEDFDDRPLSELFLLGYACQMNDFFQKNKTDNHDDK